MWDEVKAGVRPYPAKFCGMAMNHAKEGKDAALVEAAEDHARALRGQPGCVDAYVLSERGTHAQVSISFFTSEATFLEALEATRPVIARHHLDRLVTGESTFRLFDVQ
jgi:heme-degrading monooxygenase HmoA